QERRGGPGDISPVRPRFRALDRGGRANRKAGRGDRLPGGEGRRKDRGPVQGQGTAPAVRRERQPGPVPLRVGRGEEGRVPAVSHKTVLSYACPTGEKKAAHRGSSALRRPRR